MTQKRRYILSLLVALTLCPPSAHAAPPDPPRAGKSPPGQCLREHYSIEGTPKTPTISFDAVAGVLEIKGRSIPENSFEYYRPLIAALQKYAAAPRAITHVNIQLDYFNTSSSKALLEVFQVLAKIEASGASSITINWHYEEDDEDMLEAGLAYRRLVKVPFRFYRLEKL